MKELQIHDCKTDEETYVELKKHEIQAYNEIHLQRCAIGSKSLPHIISVIESSVATLTSIFVYAKSFAGTGDIWEALTKCLNIQDLHIANLGEGTPALETAAVVCFASVISNNSRLKHIRLNVNTSESLAILLPALQGCIGLTELCLYWKELTSIEQVSKLYQWAKHNTTLTLLYTSKDTPHEIIHDCFTVNQTIKNSFPIVKYGCFIKLWPNASKEMRQSIPDFLDRDTMEMLVRSLKDRGYTKWNSIKLVILGHGEVGKSTLIDTLQKYISLKNKKKSKELILQYNQSLQPQSTRTIGIDISTMKLESGLVMMVWDFGGQLEYAVTHQFVLSSKMVIYILCYDLSANSSTQLSQIAYWLNFLHSTLSFSQHDKTQWKVIIVGTKQDLCEQRSSINSLLAWQTQWPNLPLHNKQIITSSQNKVGTEELYNTLENICSNIVTNHLVLVPRIYRCLNNIILGIADKDCVMSLAELQSKYACYMEPQEFENAVTFLHSVGQLVKLPGELVCTNPRVIPKIAAKFISPEEVQIKLLAKEPVKMLYPYQIEIIMIQEEHKRIENELILMEQIGVCFKFASSSTITYLFPSLATPSDKITFALKDTSNLQFAGMQVIAPAGKIFTAGFLCQLFVKCFAGFNVTVEDLLSVHCNGIVIACQTPFMGQLIVKMENEPNALVFLMAGLNPDIAFATHIFYELVEKQLPNYGIIVSKLLCPKCIKEIAAAIKIGTIDEGFEVQLCKPYMHKISGWGKVMQIENNTNISEQIENNINISEQIENNTNISEQIENNTNISEQVENNTNSSEQIEYNTNISEQVKIGTLIGKGGYATVYKGELNGTIVAVKKIFNHELINLGSEAKIAATLKHDYVLPILGVCSLRTELWIIMEFGDGGSLYSQLGDLKKDIPWSTRWQWATQATSAVAYLHSEHVVHRDIKSPNFVISNGVLKITDFGLSINRTAATSSFYDYELGGSVRWLAPECTSDNVNNWKSDVYSLGLVLWEIASRRIPFSDVKGESKLISKVKKGKRPNIPADCPATYKIIIKKCWDQLPKKRPTASEVKDMVQQAAQNAEKR